jgi:protein-S-isoprenylcysteine O-methyltransferase Ste14
LKSHPHEILVAVGRSATTHAAGNRVADMVPESIRGPIQTDSGRVAKALSRQRIRLSLVLFSLLILDDVLEGRLPRHTNPHVDHWAQIGLVLVGLGVTLRTWAAGVIAKGKELARNGPYCLTRHPLYVGSLLMILGFSTLISDGRNVWIALAVTALLYGVRIRREERTLSMKFGLAWRQYVARTAFLLPRRLPLAIRCKWSVTQWVRNREYRTLLATAAGLVALSLWRRLL